MANEAKIEQWKASSDGPPWTHTIGSHANASKTAREMRNDGFSGVRVDRYEPADAESFTGMESAMQDGLEKFVHDENIKKLTALLTVEASDDRREMLTRLLAEETLRLLSSGWSETRWAPSLLSGSTSD